jgi:preprotein translocase subunit SecY
MAQQDLVESPVKELVRRFLVTFVLGVVVFRLGTFVPIPGVDALALKAMITGAGDSGNPLNAMIAYANMFNGGAIQQASIFGLGITPYISASIIMQLMAFSIPALKALQKEGETGRRKINQYTRYLTLAIAIVQSLIAALALAKYTGSNGALLLTADAAANHAWFIAQAVLVITTGSMLILWIADQITRFGIGNGSSIVIMIGIMAYLPTAFTHESADLAALLGLLAVSLAIIAAIIVVVQAVRRVNLEQQRRVQGNKVYGGAQTTLPLKLNQANVIPVIFASPVIMVVSMLASNWLSGIGMDQFMAYGNPGHRLVFGALIVAFTYFYISITFDLNDLTNHFKQAGFFIRGIRPGKNTVDYLNGIMTRVTFVGAVFLALISILPETLANSFGLGGGRGAVLLGGTGLLIVVGVCLDIMQKVSSFLLAGRYGGGSAAIAGSRKGGPKRF